MKTLYYGDNLEILRRYVKDESVDLVYLDPPFNSARTYNAFFHAAGSTKVAASQIRAFEDTWSWNTESEKAYEELVLKGEKVGQLLMAFRAFLGENDMMAYLTMMAPRLEELHRVLKSTGSLYLHCDPTASHYLKLLLDAIMGPGNFANEIIWRRTTTKNDYKQGAVNWPRVHDVILAYYKSTDKARAEKRFQQQFEPYAEEYTEKCYNLIDPKSGRRYQLTDLTAPGAGSRGHPCYEFMGITRYWRYAKDKMEDLAANGRIIQTAPGNVPRYKRYLDEMPGVAIGDMWSYIPALQGQADERLGYPTQKPLALLERIIKASTKPGDTVLDPFCGCGTAVDAAEGLGRNWIGIDVTALAISLIKSRLKDRYGNDVEFVNGKRKHEPVGNVVTVIGEPTTADDAAKLAQEDGYQFQFWALGLLGARPVRERKGADSGIDGKILFREDPKNPKHEEIIIQVKGGKTDVSDVRDLVGTMARTKAAMGLLITLQEPSKPMKTEAASAGFYTQKLNGQKLPKVQIRTVAELLDGKMPARPSAAVSIDETLPKAPAATKAGTQLALI